MFGILRTTACAVRADSGQLGLQPAQCRGSGGRYWNVRATDGLGLLRFLRVSVSAHRGLLLGRWVNAAEKRSSRPTARSDWANNVS